MPSCHFVATTVLAVGGETALIPAGYLLAVYPGPLWHAQWWFLSSAQHRHYSCLLQIAGMALEAVKQPVINGYFIAGSLVGPGGAGLIKVSPVPFQFFKSSQLD